MASLVLGIPPYTTVHVLTPHEFTVLTKGVVKPICGQRTWKSKLRLDRAPFYQLVNKLLGLHKLNALGWAFTSVVHVIYMGRCQLLLPEHLEEYSATTTPSERKARF